MARKRGPVAKPADQRHGHRRPAHLVAVPPSGVLVAASSPAPPANLLKRTRDAWDVYWRSDVATVTEEVDHQAIRRLFRLYDQFERAMDVVAKALVVRGSTGQIRVNPLAGHAAQLDGQILRLEAELGLTPLSRQRLGIAVGEATLTAAEVNRMFSEGSGDIEADAVGVEDAEVLGEFDAEE